MSTITKEELECCICYDVIGEQNNCTTPCGHKFCFVCMMKTLETNNTCPCCRAVLQEKQEEEEEDEDSEYEGDSEDDYSEFDEQDYHDQHTHASSEQIAQRMDALGYTTADLLTWFLRRFNSSSERTSGRFIKKMSKEFSEILATEDETAKREHYEKFDMMDEDTRRHNRTIPTALDGDCCFINLTTLFEN